jgi:hypothetical protein
MASKLAKLQSALDSARAPMLSVVETRPSSVELSLKSPVGSRQANRVGKVNIAAWMVPEFKNSLRLVQARRPGSIQDLLEEALNDLFAKYDVPQVAHPQ